MAGEEVVLGAAQLLLEAEHTKLKEEIDKVKEVLASGEKSFTQLTETATSEGKRLLRDRQKVDQALLDLTATTSQREMAAVDKRYASALAAARRSGQKVVELERAVAAEKRKVRLRDEADEIRGSNVLLQGKQRLAVETSNFGEAAEKTNLKLGHLKATGKLLHAQLGQLAAGLKIATIGAWGPYAAAVLGTVAVMTKLINKANEAQDSALQFLSAAQGQRLQTKEAEIDLRVANREITEQAGALEKQRAALAASTQQLEELDRVAKDFNERTFQAGAELLGVKSRKEAQDRADSLRLEVAEAGKRLKLAEQIDAVERGRKNKEFEEKLYLVAEENRETSHALELSTEEASRQRERITLEKKYLELLKDETDEGHRKALEFQRDAAFQNLDAKHKIERDKEAAALRKQEMEELRRQIAEWNRAAEERLRIERAVADTILDLKIRSAERAVEADGESEKARLNLIQANKEKEISQFAEKAVELETKARDAGIETTELERRLWEERQAIVKKYEDQIVGGVMKEAEAYQQVEKSARSAASAIASISETKAGEETHPYFLPHVVGPYTGFGADPWAKQRVTEEQLEGMRLDAMQKFPEAFGLPAAANQGAAAASTGAQVKVNVYNQRGDLVGVQTAHRQDGDGSVIDLVISDITRGGKIARSIEENFNLQRQGAG